MKPFFYINEFLEEKGFKIETFDMDLTGDKWVRLYLNWSNTFWQTKYPLVGCHGSGSGHENSEYIELEFPEFGKNPEFDMINAAKFEVGIKSKTEIPFNFKFIECTKYGVNIYFAPDSFDTGKDKALYTMVNGKFKKL